MTKSMGIPVASPCCCAQAGAAANARVTSSATSCALRIMTLAQAERHGSGIAHRSAIEHYTQLLS